MIKVPENILADKYTKLDWLDIKTEWAANKDDYWFLLVKTALNEKKIIEIKISFLLRISNSDLRLTISVNLDDGTMKNETLTKEACWNCEFFNTKRRSL